MDILIGVLNSIVNVFSYVWWLILPLFIFPLFWNLRLIYLRSLHVKKFQWTLLEVKVPQEILKTPKAMEQIFSSLSAMYSFGLSGVDRYIDGKVDPWISFEMVGHAGGIRFYIYVLSRYRNLIEAAVYSQYPAAELHEVEDYTDLLSPSLPDKVYDLWGTDIVLVRENYYPIKTYPYFEEPVEERRIDPLSIIAEVMSGLKEDEMIWLQVLVSPTGEQTGNHWQKEGMEKIEEIAGRKKSGSKGGFISSLWQWAKNLFWAPMKEPVWEEAKKDETAAVIKFLHPAEQEIVKAISSKIAKPGFETDIRFIYVDKRDSFTSANATAVIGAFGQFRTQDLNLFKPDKKTMTLKTGWRAKFFPRYKQLVEFSRKRKIYEGYVHRRFGRSDKILPQKFPVLNIEELATIYHFPAIMVEAPKLRKLEAKKAGPPPELPIG